MRKMGWRMMMMRTNEEMLESNSWTPIWQMTRTEITDGYRSDEESTLFASDDDIDGDNELNWYFTLTSARIDIIYTMISIDDSY